MPQVPGACALVPAQGTAPVAHGGYAYRIEHRSPDGSWRIVATGDVPNGRHPEAVARGLLERCVLDRADRTVLAVAALVPVRTPRHRVPRQRRWMNVARRNRKEGSR